MSFVHGKDTEVEVNSVDISAFTNSTTWSPSASSHDVTTYGRNSRNYKGGLKDGTATIGGMFDNAAASTPALVLNAALGGNLVPFVYRPAGTGTGLAERTVQVLVTAYEESAPVADMVSWTATLQFSGDVTDVAQV